MPLPAVLSEGPALRGEPQSPDFSVYSWERGQDDTLEGSQCRSSAPISLDHPGGREGGGAGQDGQAEIRLKGDR